MFFLGQAFRFHSDYRMAFFGLDIGSFIGLVRFFHRIDDFHRIGSVFSLDRISYFIGLVL